MKIRPGFVSNSSSTSFTFCFKGNNIQDLFSLMRKYKKHFDLSYDDYNINVESVIGAMKEVEPANRRRWGGYRIMSLAGLLDQYLRDLESLVGYIKEYEKDDSPYTSMKQYYLADKFKVEREIAHVKRLIDKGFTTAIVVGFGDNDGEISGGAVGTTMDYEGRGIDVKEKDLVIFTEQNR